MGPVRPVNTQVEQHILRWRTSRGRATAETFLSLLDVAPQPRGAPRPALPHAGGTWGYHVAERGRRGYLAPCGNAKAAAEQVEDLLKHRMFPSTW